MRIFVRDQGMRKKITAGICLIFRGLIFKHNPREIGSAFHRASAETYPPPADWAKRPFTDGHYIGYPAGSTQNGISAGLPVEIQVYLFSRSFIRVFRYDVSDISSWFCGSDRRSASASRNWTRRSRYSLSRCWILLRCCQAIRNNTYSSGILVFFMVFSLKHNNTPVVHLQWS